jgi:hypothetical protein
VALHAGWLRIEHQDGSLDHDDGDLGQGSHSTYYVEWLPDGCSRFDLRLPHRLLACGWGLHMGCVHDTMPFVSIYPCLRFIPLVSGQRDGPPAPRTIGRYLWPNRKHA